MANAKFYLDCRRVLADGKNPLCIAVSHQKKTRYVRLGVGLSPAEWDGSQVGRSNPLAPRLNTLLARKLADARSALLDLELGGRPFTVSEAATAIAVRIDADKAARVEEQERMARERADDCRRVAAVARRYAALKTARSTAESYECLARHVERYAPGAMLDAVGREWLAGFDAFLSPTARSVNARGVYMRNLRAVFNFAIDEGLTANYPFRKFKIRREATMKRSLSAEDMRRIITMDVCESQRAYRDFFALSFFLLGTNAKDLLLLPPDAADGGRVSFHRAKTGKLYSILVPPEAAAIIARYRGERHLLRFMDTCSDHKTFLQHCNPALRSLGMTVGKGRKPSGQALWPFLTTYYARHTWATIAAELDIPKETIAAALGHDMGNSTTAIYINFNLRKVDDANRRVIDFVMRGQRPMV